MEQYLLFFTDTLVRNSGSAHEYALAEKYADFVREQEDPLTVPLMIPEYRYGGLAKKHEYRLDFLVINPFTMDKIGFELSPWSTHGYLKKIKGLTQAKINEMARDNFEGEMEKHRSFFKKHDIYALIYTDKNLKDIDKLFDDDIAPLLLPEKPEPTDSFRARYFRVNRLRQRAIGLENRQASRCRHVGRDEFNTPPQFDSSRRFGAKANDLLYVAFHPASGDRISHEIESQQIISIGKFSPLPFELVMGKCLTYPPFYGCLGFRVKKCDRAAVRNGRRVPAEWRIVPATSDRTR